MRFEVEWLEQPETPALSEELLTRCRMGMFHGDTSLFCHEDLLGEHQVRESIIASAYPLALWFAANWWRLRWEPFPIHGTDLHDWHMSHMMGAAGGGYVWPNLTLVSDGENIHLRLQPTQEGKGPLRYLSSASVWVPAHEYEFGIDQLVEATLMRLDERAEQAPLQDLWQAVRDERADPVVAMQRQLEARLGFDPEEAPASLINLLTQLGAVRGEEAVQELACLGHEEIEGILGGIEESLRSTKDTITLPLRNMRLTSRLITVEDLYPWKKGRDAANQARKFLGLDDGPLLNKRLAELLETSKSFLEDTPTHESLPVSIGEVASEGKAKVTLGKRRKESRRFMAARIMAAGVYDGREGRWLPCTNAATVKQKFQRAFAQEFLCPYEDLIAWMDTESPDEELMDAAAEHFEVSPLLVNTVMVNHGHISAAELGAFQAT